MPENEAQNPLAGVNRRQFLGSSACNAAGLAAGLVGFGAATSAFSANETVGVGIIGTRRQGRKLAAAFSKCPNTEVRLLCDVDGAVLERARRELAESCRSVRGVRHFRQLLDSPEIDAVAIATPDHSHAILASEALQAGKDVYLEAPVVHTIAEGQALRMRADAAGRIIQPGLFDRSLPHVREALEFVRSGRLGRLPLVKAWSVQRRRPAKSASADAPADVDYAGWLYPHRERPFEPSRFHRGWNDHWDYGSGDLGTWGAPLLDLARAGIGMECPERVSAVGHQSSAATEETPDTLHVTYANENATILWEHRRWSNHAPEGRSTGVAFHGEAGTLVLDRGGWKVYDGPEAGGGGRSDLSLHVGEFLTAVRARRAPRLCLSEAIRSANLCHLGNLAYRLGRELTPASPEDPLADDHEARQLDSTGIV